MAVDVKQFINNWKDLIQNKQWSDIYNIFNSLVSEEGETGDFTRMLLNAGINPLEQGLTYVPAFYMYVGDETDPSKIKIHEIEIPEGITKVMDYAFWGNKQLERVIFAHSCKNIYNKAFGNCPNLKEIIYKGTWEEWKDGDNTKLSWDFVGTKYITCTDGRYNIYSGEKQ